MKAEESRISYIISKVVKLNDNGDSFWKTSQEYLEDTREEVVGKITLETIKFLNGMSADELIDLPDIVALDEVGEEDEKPEEVVADSVEASN